MSAEQIFVGIDIGTTEVRTVVGALGEDQEIPSVTGAGSAKNVGMRRGIVVNIDEVATSIISSVEDAERISGQKVTNALVNINGEHIISLNSRGAVAIGGVGKEITVDDIVRAEETAAVVQLPVNREILQVFAKNYHIDGQQNIKDPIGMSGVRLEIEALMVTAATPNLKALEKSMERAGIAINNKIVSGLAASEAVLRPIQRESGSAVVDIGATTTNIVVVEDDDVQHVAVLPVGSMHITNDLAIGLTTDLAVADIVKTREASLRGAGGKNNAKTIKVELNEETYIFNRSDVEAIIEARLEETFELVNDELKKVGRDGRLPGGVVLVGGGALLPGIDEVAKTVLKLPAQIGVTKNYSGIVDVVKSPRYATAVGLMLLDMRMNEGATALRLQRGQIFDSLTKLFKKFIP